MSASGAAVSRAREISERLAERAEEVCCVYLSNGRRAGDYWRVGNVENASGRSLWVRIRGPRHLIGRWRDEAEEGAYGDLLDLIRMNGGFEAMSGAMVEAERFLGTVRRLELTCANVTSQADGSSAARRLFARGREVAGTLGETYLRSRALGPPSHRSVRFLSNAYFVDDDGARRSGPALLAAIRALDGTITGVHRTFIGESAEGPFVLSRRILGRARGNAVHLCGTGATALVGEGLETVWSLHGAVDGVRLFAALSAAKLALWRWPPEVTRLLIAVDKDDNGAGEKAARRLIERAGAAHLPAVLLYPRLGDFNDDLRKYGLDALRLWSLRQLSQVSSGST